MVYIKGTTPDSGRFSINFLEMSTPTPNLTSIAFHFNPRLDESVIVRNTRINGVWEVEETGGGMPLTANEEFSCGFVSQMYGFEVEVNGDYFTQYKYRVPITEEMFVLMYGLPKIEKIEYI